MQAADLFKYDFCFTGGEAMSAFEALKEGIKRAGELGCSVSLVSNSGWAISDDIADERILILSRLGLKNLCLSYDSYHSACDSDLFNKVKRVILSARKNDIYVAVRYCGDNKGDISLNKAEELAALSGNKLEKTMFERLAPAGRAKKLFVKRQLEFSDINGEACDLVHSPAPYFNGLVYACCGASFGASRKGSLVLGDLCNEDARSILERALRDDILNALLVFGPKWLLGKLSAISQEKILSKLWHHGSCLLCRKILDNKEIVSELKEVLPKFRREIFSTVAGWQWKRGIRGDQEIGSKSFLQEEFDDFVTVVSNETEVGQALDVPIYEALKLFVNGDNVETVADILWAKYGQSEGISGEEALGLVKKWEIQLKDLKLL